MCRVRIYALQTDLLNPMHVYACIVLLGYTYSFVEQSCWTVMGMLFLSENCASSHYCTFFKEKLQHFFNFSFLEKRRVCLVWSLDGHGIFLLLSARATPQLASHHPSCHMASPPQPRVESRSQMQEKGNGKSSDVVASVGRASLLTCRDKMLLLRVEMWSSLCCCPNPTERVELWCSPH